MTPDRSTDGTARVRLWLIGAIAVVLIGWALRATGTFMVPVVFSVFLALLVASLDRWVTHRVPVPLGWLGHVAAMGTIVVAMLVFVGLIWIAAQQVVERFPMPDDMGQLDSILPDRDMGTEGAAESGPAPGLVTGPGDAESGSGGSSGDAGASDDSNGVLKQFAELYQGAGGSLAQRVGDWASGLATQILGMAGTMLGATVLVFFLTLIMLIEGPDWKRKTVTALEASTGHTVMHSISVTSARLRRYLLARTLLGMATGVLYGAWLWIFGVDLLVVWVLLAFVLNYIPTFGSLVAGALPVAYAFLQKDFGTAFLIGTGIFVIEQVMGNYIDPRVQGRQVSLSSLVILVTLLVWAWIWGVAGAILAVPITITAMIVCAHIPALRPFALMLSNATDMQGLKDQTGISDPSPKGAR